MCSRFDCPDANLPAQGRWITNLLPWTKPRAGEPTRLHRPCQSTAWCSETHEQYSTDQPTFGRFEHRISPKSNLEMQMYILYMQLVYGGRLPTDGVYIWRRTQILDDVGALKDPENRPVYQLAGGLPIKKTYPYTRAPSLGCLIYSSLEVSGVSMNHPETGRWYQNIHIYILYIFTINYIPIPHYIHIILIYIYSHYIQYMHVYIPCVGGSPPQSLAHPRRLFGDPLGGAAPAGALWWSFQRMGKDPKISCMRCRVSWCRNLRGPR